MPGLLRGMARTAVVAGTATAVSNRVSRRQANRWAQQEAQPQQYAEPPQQYAAAARGRSPRTRSRSSRSWARCGTRASSPRRSSPSRRHAYWAECMVGAAHRRYGGIGVPIAVLVALLVAAPAAVAQLPPTAAPLPGSTFQGGDGNQDDGAVAIDWQAVQAAGRVQHNPDDNDEDSAFRAAARRTSPASGA